MINVRAFVRYCRAKIEAKAKNEAYRIYVTDALKVLTDNTVRINGGASMSMRYADIDKPHDTRTAAEIVADVARKAGLVVV